MRFEPEIWTTNKLHCQLWIVIGVGGMRVVRGRLAGDLLLCVGVKRVDRFTIGLAVAGRRSVRRVRDVRFYRLLQQLEMLFGGGSARPATNYYKRCNL